MGFWSDIDDELKDNALKYFSEIWHTELFMVSSHHITVGNIVSGLLFVSIALVLAKILKIKSIKYLTKNSRFTQQQIITFGNLFYYIILTILVLLALKIANIPLTTFTIIGGALVIGLGFGSQTIVSNFMSGLILLGERPIKIGDVIEIEDAKGVVEYLGARSTRIRTMNNISVIIPNSMMLNSKITNWTLIERAVLIEVKVGVAYGSDTSIVKEILKQAVENTDEVIHELGTIVTFNDFGSSSLEFGVRFYIKIINHLQKEMIMSDVRFKIDELAKEKGIVIAFNQLDVHLDIIKKGKKI